MTSTDVITTHAICASSLAFSGQSEPTTGNFDDVYDYGGQAFAQVYVYAYTEDNDGLNATVSGYDPGNDTWQVIGQQVDGGNALIANQYPFPPTYTAVRVQLDDIDNNDLIWYDYHFAVCREPTIAMSPLSQESLVQPGATVFYTHTVYNYTMDADTFSLTVSGNSWPITLWSGGVQISDTGTLLDQEAFIFTARIEVPAGASAGDTDEFTIQAQSTASPLSRTVSLRTSVVAHQWVQAFSDEWATNATGDREQYLDIVGTGTVTNAQMTDDSDWQNGPPAVAAYPQRGIVAAWVSSYHSNGTATYYNVEYAAFDTDGDILIPITQVSDNISATLYTREYHPTLAVDPVNGNVLVTWYRDVETNNVYYAVRSKGGSEIAPPTALTTNTLYSVEDELPSVAAFGSGGFAVTWQHHDSAGSRFDIHYAVISSTGNIITGPIKLTDVPGEYAYRPRANRLSDGNVIITWRGNHGFTNQVCYAVLDSAGNVVQPLTRLTDVPDSTYESDAVDLQNGNTIVAWRQYIDSPPANYQIAFTVLDDVYTATVPITTPTILTNTLSNYNYHVSLARDGDDNAVLTWIEGSEWRLHYALVDNTGAVLTWPMVWRTARGDELEISWSGGGSGSFPTIQLSQSIYLPVVLRNG